LQNHSLMLSIAITTFNRSDLTIESFSKVFDHQLVSEIVIVDDASDEGHFNRLMGLLEAHPAILKIKLFRNKVNLGMSRNKSEAINKASNEWVVILDSDNVLYPEYLDAINKQPLLDEYIFCPIKAEPDYDFSNLPVVIDKGNAKYFLEIKEFRILLNTCNYLVNRDKYLEVYKYDPSIQESDTIYFNTLWLEAGYSFYIVPGMSYFHRRHDGSGWLNGNHQYNLKKAAELQEKIRNL
jgi:glycosyltransferase involved in cell wall biosynthesis